MHSVKGRQFTPEGSKPFNSSEYCSVSQIHNNEYHARLVHLEEFSLGPAVVVLHAKKAVHRRLGDTAAGKRISRVDGIQGTCLRWEGVQATPV